ncbi:MAG: hypothetical protein KAI24_01455 [Planctomycetes bacterium]|nr:hypothetical protein [Planctomycetota bacterium]
MLRNAFLAAAVCAFAGAASAQCSATVTATNNAGQVTIDLDGDAPMAFAFFVVGDTLGTTPINLGNFASFDLGLAAPFVPAPAGLTDINGDVSLSFAVPSTAPAGTYYVQGVTVGFAFTPGTPPSIDVCTSNVASLSI